jgi:hypothetical protein
METKMAFTDGVFTKVQVSVPMLRREVPAGILSERPGPFVEAAAGWVSRGGFLHHKELRLATGEVLSGGNVRRSPEYELPCRNGYAIPVECFYEPLV